MLLLSTLQDKKILGLGCGGVGVGGHLCDQCENDALGVDDSW